MAFQVNTNVNALNAHAQSTFTQYNLKNSMEKLSSGLRINKAADDASGMAIADSLRSQASALGQAIRNTNDGMGIIQIADKAMDEQLKILDTIKSKAVQAAQDGQSTQSRSMIQMDIIRLIEGLDSIGNNTTYNGMALLSGAFTNKEFQVGAYSNQSIKTSIGSTTSDKIGQVRIETGALVTASGEVTVTFKNVDGVNDITLESVKVSHSAGTGLGVLAEVINKNSDKTGVRAQANAYTTSDESIKSGSLANLMVNGVSIGDIIEIVLPTASVFPCIVPFCQSFTISSVKPFHTVPNVNAPGEVKASAVSSGESAISTIAFAPEAISFINPEATPSIATSAFSKTFMFFSSMGTSNSILSKTVPISGFLI